MVDGAPGIRTPWTELIRTVFGIDLRALAALRIGTGLLILADLFGRARDVVAFYSDEGTLPRTLLIEKGAESPWCYSFHLLSGQPSIQLLLFSIAAVFAVALTLGFHAKSATAASWVLLVSLQYRNPIILQGGDVLLRLLLFWGLFLPWGDRYSVQGDPNARTTAARPFLSIATFALLLQICFVYWFSARLKSDPSWTRDFTAIYEAFSLDHFAKPLGKMLLPHHRTLRALTAASYWIEVIGPVAALLAGVISWRLRAATVFLFFGFHASMAVCLELGFFPAICSVAWLAFLPAPFWSGCEKLLSRPLSGVRVRADRVWGALGSSKIGPPPPTSLQGKNARVPNSSAWAANTLAGVFLLYILLWNLRTTNFTRFAPLLPPSTDSIAWLSGVAQVWDMFSPGPLTEGGWFVMPAHLANGNVVDIFRGGAPVSWEKPALVSRMYPNDRWRKYMVLIAAASNTSLRPGLADYLFRHWNSTHAPQSRIVSLEIILMEQDTLPEKGFSSPRPIQLWTESWNP